MAQTNTDLIQDKPDRASKPLVKPVPHQMLVVCEGCLL